MATVTSKGQITLPKAVRDALDLVPGSEVDFAFEGNQILLRRKVPIESFEKWRGHLRGRLPAGAKTVDELMVLLRGEKPALQRETEE